ncbi:amidase, partial [Tremellales sp. Uapishka_1]
MVQTTKPIWSDIAAQKVAARDALIPAEWKIAPTDALNVLDVPASCGILSAQEIKITELSAEVLVQKMIDSELKSYDVVLAFCKRAAIAQQLTNCLTEILFEEALVAAKSIDAAYEETKTPAGLLHGLPVSLKDNFNIKGVDTTVGYIAWANDPRTAADESEMTKVLRECGAVLFCKTNVPTAMMIAESYNNVWDYTTNPYNRGCSSGGSSGGESALIALKGSPLGVGTDIGGSLRIPASFTGIYTIKPSFGRFPTYGARSGMPGQEAVKSINGPMSSTIGGMELWAKAIVGNKPWERDPNMLPIPWREVTLPEKLCFGLILDNGLCKPTPPVLRALQETKAALEKAGHKVVEWTAYDPPAAISLLERFFVGDGGVKIASVIAEGEEPWPKGLEAYAAAHEKATKSAPPTVGDLWTLQAERTSYAKKALDHWMASQTLTGTGRPFDGVISPTTAYSACPKYTFSNVTYTSLWNITDQSSVVFPVTFASKDDVKPEYKARSAEEAKIWDRYDPEEVVGAPVGLQMITMRLEEEKAVELVKIARAALTA